MSNKNKLINFYEDKDVKKFLIEKENPGKKQGLHNIDLEMLALITGPTSSGKTTILLNLINVMPKTFDKITLCLKDSDEPLYNMLIDRIQKKNGEIDVFEDGDVPLLSDIEKDGQQLFVFDDLVGEKESNKQISQYYKLGRKKFISSVYLTQSYYQSPKFVRDQIQYLFIKQVRSNIELKRILNDYAFTHITLDQMINYYEECTKEFTDFMLIDVKKKKIYHNFTKLLNG